MANGSALATYWTEETTNYGETPNNPALTPMRVTGQSVGLTRTSIQSAELRSDGQIADYRLGNNNVSGDLPFELSYASHDFQLQQMILSADWASPATTGTTMIDATGTGFSRAAGSFLTDGFEVGMLVKSSGFEASGFNGNSYITAVDELTMTTTPLSGTHDTEAGDGDELIVAADRIQGGITRSYMTLINHYSDLLAANYPYYIKRGIEIAGSSLNVSPDAIVTGTFNCMGQSLEIAQDLTGLGTPTFNAVSTGRPFDSFSGQIMEGGSVIATVTSLDFAVANGIAPIYVVGSRNTIFPGRGRLSVTGTLNSIFADASLVNKFVNETDSNLTFTLSDINGSGYRFRIPLIRYTGGQPDVASEAFIPLAMPFQAILDPATGTNIIIERFTA